MSRLWLTFYGDDFTGSTDALEQLTLAGVRAVLFIKPPNENQLRRFPGLQAVGVAGMTRAMPPAQMEKNLRAALKKLKSLGARHVHYKVCSTFDSSPAVGSIGKAMDIGASIFRAAFIPVLAAAPGLGRYTIFGNHFARYGIGSAGEIHRLDQHPSISKHPVTPMTEADLRVHLARQTKKKAALFDILKMGLPEAEARRALKEMVAGKPGAILFDAITENDLRRFGVLMDEYATAKQPLFSIGSSGVEAALAATFDARGSRRERAPTHFSSDPGRLKPAATVLIGSGSCSPVTAGQIEWALKHGFAEVALNCRKLSASQTSTGEIIKAAESATRLLNAGRSVIAHTTRRGADKRVAAKLKGNTAAKLGTALGMVLNGAVAESTVSRICIAGGDTSSFAARAMGIEAVEMIARLTPGAPVCRAHAPRRGVDGREVVFKGGQVGPENYFELLKGKAP